MVTMGYDYKTELILPQGLRIECIQLFKQCREFDTPSDLRTFARVTHLTLVVDCIPSKAELYHNELILNLLKTRNKTTLEPALFDLLDALAVEYQQQLLGERFRTLKDEIRGAFLQVENPEQEKDFLQLVEDSAPDEGPGADRAAQGWIEEAGDDRDELALRITLAVFNGTTFDVIERAKKELFELLKELAQPSPLPDPGQPPPAVNHVPLKQRLKQAGARETEGRPPYWRRVIELEKPRLASEAFVYVWELNRETEWRRRLIEWLTNHAAGRTADVRNRAAVAVGRVAVKDYRFVRDKILNAWVRKNDPQFRTAIGMALGVLVREASFAEEVQSLLRDWSGSEDKAKRWAAMRAYIYVGAHCRPPGEAIARWREIASSEPPAILIPISENEAVRLNNPLHMSLMDAMVRFFVGVARLPKEERRPLVGDILRELKAWVAATDGSAWLGLFLFTALGQMPVGARGGAGSNGAPLVLQLLEEGPAAAEYRSQLAGLLELGMRNGATIIETQELLCGWLGWLDRFQGDSRLYESRMLTLFKDIIAADGGGRMRGKLAACLRDCGRNRAAQRLLSAL